MATAFIILCVVGVLLMAAGGIMHIVAAFRVSIGWGLAYLFLPLASLVFLLPIGRRRKRAF